MKKILSILVILTLIFSLSACMPKEVKQKKLDYENNAKVVMTEFFNEHYDNYEITKIEHLTFVPDGGAFKELHDSTEILTKINGKDYVFYYNQITKEIFSNINNENVNNELSGYFDQYNFPKDYYKNSIKIKSYNYEYETDVLNIEDDTLEKVIKRNRESEETYYEIYGDFYYENKDITYESFEIKEFLSNLRYVSINFYNVNNNYNENPYDFNILKKIRFYVGDYNKTPSVNLTEYKSIEKDGIYFVYTPKYFDINVQKISKDAEQLTDDITNRKYKSNGIWYQINATKLYDSYPQPVFENGYQVSHTVSPGISIFVETEKFKDKSFYVKSFEFAEKYNVDNDNYIRYFLFCDQEKAKTEEICFVTNK